MCHHLGFLLVATHNHRYSLCQKREERLWLLLLLLMMEQQQDETP
jgi:hypothetical protein